MAKPTPRNDPAAEFAGAATTSRPPAPPPPVAAKPPPVVAPKAGAPRTFAEALKVQREIQALPENTPALRKEKAEKVAWIGKLVMRMQNPPVVEPSAKEMQAVFRKQDQRAKADRLAMLALSHPEVRELIAERDGLRKKLEGLTKGS